MTASNPIFKYNREAYEDPCVVEKYVTATDQVGLWNSEKYVMQKYFSKDDYILDIACGAGRTTLGMYALGIQRLVGIDASTKMILAARSRVPDTMAVHFQCADVCNLPFDNHSFSAAFASYNIMMMIPTQLMRERAFQEVSRVMKPNAIFAFTASNRDCNPIYRDFWTREKEKWEKNQQDMRLCEYGDQIYTECGNEVFIHFSTTDEVCKLLTAAGFTLLESFFRSNFHESITTQQFSGDTMFYIARKQASHE